MARGWTSARLAAWVFAGVLVITFFWVLLDLGSYHWFFGDDWLFLTDREATSLDDLFRPHGDTHWTTVPILVTRGLWALFGLKSYVPYQACVLVLHLTACVLLRVIMRRAGVGPWIATAAASAFALFGPGSQNIVWAFQIAFNLPLVLGLVHLLLADHDGPLDRRDALGIAAGVLALMSSAIGILMAIIVGVAALLRRGWRVALVHTAPLAAAYLIWWLAVRPGYAATGQGNPSISAMLRWIRSGVTGTFLAMGHFRVVAATLAVVLVVGAAMTAVRSKPLRELVSRLAVPLAMLVGSAVLHLMTVQSRQWMDPELARSGRYLHIGTALTLPMLAIAADAITRRWRVLTPVLVVLFVVAIPWNLGDFERDVFASRYMERRKSVLTNIVRLPEARMVPRDVRPFTDPRTDKADIGFLLDTLDAGKLAVPTEPLPTEFSNELRVRLGVAQRQRPLPAEMPVELRRLRAGTPPPPGAPARCQRFQGALDIRSAAGTEWWIDEPVTITTRESSRNTSIPVKFSPLDGHSLTFELDGLDLRIQGYRGADSFIACDLPT